jgi:hypothetical protein
MIISIAIGKGRNGQDHGGDQSARLLGKRAVYVDADVEAPNGTCFCIRPSSGKVNRGCPWCGVISINALIAVFAVRSAASRHRRVAQIGDGLRRMCTAAAVA